MGGFFTFSGYKTGVNFTFSYLFLPSIFTFSRFWGRRPASERVVVGWKFDSPFFP